MRWRPRRVSVLVALAVAVSTTAAMPAAEAGDAGRLDPRFGEIKTEVDSWGIELTDTAVTAGGEVVAVGTGREADPAVVTKIRRDGTVDPDFGERPGRTTLPVPGDRGVASAVTVDTDGSIIVVGETTAGGYVARLDQSGALDPDLGGNGVVVLPAAEDLAGVAVDANGRILVIGRTMSDDLRYDWSLTRLLPNGAIDPSFGTDGSVRLGRPGVDDHGSDVHIDGNDRIHATGELGGAKAVARFSGDGVLDLSYGDEGVASGPIKEAYGGRGESLLLEDGRVVVAYHGADHHVWISRFTASGMVDTTFGEDGTEKVRVHESLRYHTVDLALHADGGYVVGGTVSWVSHRAYLMKVLPEGGLDPTFGDGGITLECCPDARAVVTALPDGRVLVLHPDDVPQNLIVGGPVSRHLVATAYFTGDADLGPFDVAVTADHAAVRAAVTPALQGSWPVEFTLHVAGAGSCTTWTGDECAVEGLVNGRAYAVEVTIDHASLSGRRFAAQTVRPRLACDRAPDHHFADVSSKSFADDDVACLLALGITTGTGPTTYSPDDTVTREQMAAFLARSYRVVSGDRCGEGPTPFGDIADSFATADIACIYGLGITTGTSATTYGPDQHVTREQMAAFLARFHRRVADTSCDTTVSSPFGDIADSFATADIACIYGLGITTGTSATTYGPDQHVTREQMAAFLARLYRLT